MRSIRRLHFGRKKAAGQFQEKNQTVAVAFTMRRMSGVLEGRCTGIFLPVCAVVPVQRFSFTSAPLFFHFTAFPPYLFPIDQARLPAPFCCNRALLLSSSPGCVCDAAVVVVFTHVTSIHPYGRAYTDLSIKFLTSIMLLSHCAVSLSPYPPPSISRSLNFIGCR